MLRVYNKGHLNTMRRTDKQLAHDLLAHRSKGYSLGYVISVSRRRYAFSFMALVVLALIWGFAEDPFLRAFCLFGVGMYAGAFLRDIGWLRRLRMNWPFTERVIDWKKVEEMAKLDA